MESYAKLTPDKFRFTVKSPNSITLTHLYKQASKEFAERPNLHFLNRKLMSAFARSLEPFKDKIGVLMFRFEYLNKFKMPSMNSSTRLAHSWMVCQAILNSRSRLGAPIT